MVSSSRYDVEDDDDDDDDDEEDDGLEVSVNTSPSRQSKSTVFFIVLPSLALASALALTLVSGPVEPSDIPLMAKHCSTEWERESKRKIVSPHHENQTRDI